MGIVCSYDDQCGNVYPEAFWRPVLVEIDIANRTAKAVFRAWKSEAEYDAGRDPLPIPRPQEPGRVAVSQGDAYGQLAASLGDAVIGAACAAAIASGLFPGHVP